MTQLPKNVRVSAMPNVIDAKTGVVTYHISYTTEIEVKIPEEATKDKDFTQQYIDYAVKQLIQNVREAITGKK